MDLGELMGAAPRIRMRSVDERQRGQLAELAVLNERLAGRQSWQIRQKLEHLKSRRRIWELIYEYVTKRDAITSLAMIEEANNKVSHEHNQAHPAQAAAALPGAMDICSGLAAGRTPSESTPHPLVLSSTQQADSRRKLISETPAGPSAGRILLT